jgi:hypothetical protein
MGVERTAHRLEHILEAIRGIEDTVAGLSRDTVMEHWTLRSAVERGLEIISEATRHLPSELTDAHPEVPWKTSEGSAISCGTNTTGSSRTSFGRSQAKGWFRSGQRLKRCSRKWAEGNDAQRAGHLIRSSTLT